MQEIEVSADAESLIDTVVHAHRYIMDLRRAKVELENRLDGKNGHEAATDEDIVEGLRTNLNWVITKLRENGSEFAEEEAAKSLRVLGFDDAAQQKSTNSLSGGLRMRVALCAAFFVQADVLLLDEPTNHLDFPSLLWLENRLRSYRNIFVMVCHDREILMNVCNSVMQITEDKGLKDYDCDFGAYEKQRDKFEKKRAADVDRFLDRHRNIDFSSPLAAQVARKREWLEAYNRKLVLRQGQFTFPAPQPLLPDNHQLGMTLEDPQETSVIKVTDVRFSYDPVTLPFIFDNPINIDIKMGTRMGVMGPNGAGKSTFLKLITGRLQPVEGTISTNKNAKIAYFAQHHSAEMDLNMTPTDFMISRFPETKVGQLKAHLAKVGCSGDLTQTRMVDVSQGLRSCILFAAITFECPSLLIMDEPTNFLDIETVDALISATNKYVGSLLLVSHSRLFLNKCATTYLSIVPGQFLIFDTLAECEKSTYTFIAELENGGKVKMDSSALARHGANAEYGGDSEAKTNTDADGILMF
jgi:ATPase subunit of ABC transporter with duplicated ATPase domains